MIVPTVGRVVWYHRSSADPGPYSGNGPLAAIIAHVWSDTCVNLMVIDANGSTYSRTSVLLVHDGNPRPHSGFCEWMPYQKGQAAKTEEAQAKLGAK